MHLSHLQQSYLHQTPAPSCLHPHAQHKAGCLPSCRPCFYLTARLHAPCAPNLVLKEKGPDKAPPPKLRCPRRKLHPSLGPHKTQLRERSILNRPSLRLAHLDRSTCPQAMLIHLANTVCCHQAELFKAKHQDTPPSHCSADLTRSIATTKSPAHLLSYSEAATTIRVASCDIKRTASLQPTRKSTNARDTHAGCRTSSLWHH
ncbi:hypothetical protein AMTRI_Chr06g194600 [Amborella trichopoda]